MSLLRNAITAIRHPSVGVDYAIWRIGNAIDRPPLVNGAFCTRLRASNFAGLRATRGFVPNSAEIKMIASLSSNYPVFIDIGANVGVWTTALAAAHRTAHVYCIEPTPDIVDLLQSNIALNRLQNVTTEQLAISDSDGFVSFQVVTEYSIYNRLATRKNSAQDLHRDRFKNARTIDVRSVRLDDFCKDRCIERIGFLKVDVEGAEVCVIKGAENLLRNRAIELIWIEVEPDNLCEMGDSIDDLADAMRNVGYTFHLLQPDGSASPAVDIRRNRAPNMIAKPERHRRTS